MCNERESKNRPSYLVSPHVRAEIPLDTLHALQTHLKHVSSALERFDHESDPTHHETACRHAVLASDILKSIAL
jgi:hypothetical protein